MVLNAILPLEMCLSVKIFSVTSELQHLTLLLRPSYHIAEHSLEWAFSLPTGMMLLIISDVSDQI